VRVLSRAERIGSPEIAGLFDELKDQAGHAKARSRRVPSSPTRSLAMIKATRSRRFGKRIEATVSVNPALIGGAA
jgi:hypothetical protein